MNDEQTYDALRMQIYGKAKISVNCSDENGKELSRRDINLKEAENWSDVVLNFTEDPSPL